MDRETVERSRSRPSRPPKQWPDLTREEKLHALDVCMAEGMKAAEGVENMVNEALIRGEATIRCKVTITFIVDPNDDPRLPGG